MNYSEAFSHATGGSQPYGYQCRLACGPDAEPRNEASLRQGAICASQLIKVPTGLGKTAGVVVAWLWNRVLHPSKEHRDSWPRRLVYCLPMRTLVEQTHQNVHRWLEAFDKLWDGKGEHAGKVGLHVLMGGEESSDWDLHPEQDAILIGTQDMLLSRALNRGYGMSRYRWPMHFGLLNNDALWVMDETQLMGVGIETSAQLRGFRERFGTVTNTPTWWMSATLDEPQLATVDHRVPLRETPRLGLSSKEKELLSPLLEAKKRLHPAEQQLTAQKKDDLAAYAKAVAKEIADRHVSGTLTLAVFNRVARAQAVFEALRNSGQGTVALIHSRFRSPEREAQMKVLSQEGDRIVIATQAVEAGVDVSARTLFTELAPWPSLVQRFGRCNRRGTEFPDGADVYWINIQAADEKDAVGLALPYLPEDLARSREQLRKLSEVSLRTLTEVEVEAARPIRPVLRSKDLLDLFDTTPDLAGNDLDISRYIRDGEDSDVQVAWRELSEGVTPSEEALLPARDEVCRVSADAFGEFLRKRKEGGGIWQWNALEEEWQPAERAVPGRVYLLDRRVGGYDANLGWTANPKHLPPVLTLPVNTRPAREHSFDGMIREEAGSSWMTLAEHTQDVVEELGVLLHPLGIPPAVTEWLRTAAWWHDFGKAHPEFQAVLKQGAPEEFQGEYLAKSGTAARVTRRRHFRHELASALAWLQSADAETVPPLARDFIAYTIAAHHGKVRVSIRALPGETEPPDPTILFARGIWDGDSVPAPGAPLVAANSHTFPHVTLDLSCMRLGGTEAQPSWLSRVLGLRNTTDFGPFRLAYYETLLRAADMRASVQSGSTLTRKRRGSIVRNAPELRAV